RNPARAVQAAKKAVELAPGDSWAWQMLGWAHYRAGAWQASIGALEKSVDLQKSPKGGDPWQWFFLAMAHWHLDHKEQARKWYDRAVKWMDKNAPRHEELSRFRAEADGLMGANGKKE